MKKLKASRRGLTFSMTENDVFPIGSRYRYVIDKGEKRIIIFPSEGGNTVSRKCYGGKVLPLIDIRSKEIREIIRDADYLEMELLKDSIVVSVYKGKQCPGIDDNESEPIVSFIVPDAALNLRCYDPIIGDLLHTQELLKTNQELKEEVIRVFSVVSLFSGVGALDLPFAQDKTFKIVFSNELSPSAAAAYRENIGVEAICEDIQNVTEVPKADVVIAGIPCTPFSDVNRSKTRMKNHKDFHMIDHYLKKVKTAEAKVFAIENVPTFASEKAGCLAVIKEMVPEYQLSYRIVNDSDLGGFSIRKRLILLGSRIGEIPIPDIEMFPKRTVREALEKVTPEWFNYHDVTRPSEASLSKMKYVPMGGNYKDIPKHLRSRGIHSNVFRRLHPDQPSVSLPNWRKTNILHPTESRILSVAEASSLMGKGPDFVYLGTLGGKQQQCSNSVPLSIAAYIKSLIKNALIMNYRAVLDC